MKKLSFILFFCVSCVFVYAQKHDKPKLVQFSGVVYDVDSNTVVPHVTLKNLSSGKSYVANYKGYYSFVVNEGDSIVFSSMGYKNVTLVVPKNLKDKKFTSVVKMKTESIELPVFRVFPWASTDEFKREFLTLKLADDDEEIVRKNLKKAALKDLSYTLPRDGQEIRGMTFNNNHIGLSNQSMVQTNPLLNPLAWSAFLKQISEGNKSRNK